MPEKLKILLDKVEEVISNGDWPTEEAEDIEALCHELRADMQMGVA